MARNIRPPRGYRARVSSGGLLNAAPTLTTISTITGATEQSGKTISYATLLAASNASADTNRFRIEAVTDGTLTKGGNPVTAGVTTIGVGESVVWTSASGSFNLVDAFTLVAMDAEDAVSSPAVQVVVDTVAVPTGTGDIQFYYDNRKGADAAVVYDKALGSHSANTNPGVVGLTGFPGHEPTWNGANDGLVIDGTSTWQVIELAAVAASTKTIIFAQTNPFRTSAQGCRWGNCVFLSDGRPCSTPDLSGGEGLSPVYGIAGTVIIARRFGPNGAYFYGDANGDSTKVPNYYSTDETYTNGSFNYHGAFTSVAQPLSSTVYTLCDCDEYMTDDQIARLISYFHHDLVSRGLTLGTTIPVNAPHVVCCGDSVTKGYGQGWADWPRKLRQLYSDSLRVTNLAISGQQIATIKSLQIDGALANAYTAPSSGQKICIIYGGLNDQISGGRTGAQMISDMTALVTAARNAGAAKVIVATIQGSSGWNGTQQTAIGTYNTSVIALGVGNDAVMRTPNDTDLGTGDADVHQVNHDTMAANAKTAVDSL